MSSVGSVEPLLTHETGAESISSTTPADTPEITDEAVRAWLQHETGDNWPKIHAVVVPDRQANEVDELIATRLLASYVACKKEEAKHPSIGADIWSSIKSLQGRFLSVLESHNAKELASYLVNMSRHDATIGLTQGEGEHRWITTSKSYEQFRALLIKDKLVSFAEAVGAIRCECPEQGSWGDSLHIESDALVKSLEQAIGISLTPPDIDGGLFKIACSDALFHDRDYYAQFAAWSMREIAGLGSVVCEIGGGVGRAAYWAQRFGLGAYTILDLPHVNVLQGYYLLKSMPMDQVRLFGETVDNPKVTVWPYFQKEKIEGGTVDIVFNQDSLPEIHRDAALDYIAWSRRISARRLYSINQEAEGSYTQEFWLPATADDPKQNLVRGLVSEVTGFRQIMRAPYWLRRGYTSELYEII